MLTLLAMRPSPGDPKGEYGPGRNITEYFDLGEKASEAAEKAAGKLPDKPMRPEYRPGAGRAKLQFDLPLDEASSVEEVSQTHRKLDPPGTIILLPEYRLVPGVQYCNVATPELGSTIGNLSDTGFDCSGQPKELQDCTPGTEPRTEDGVATLQYCTPGTSRYSGRSLTHIDEFLHRSDQRGIGGI